MSCWYISILASAVAPSVMCSRVFRLNMHAVRLSEFRKYKQLLTFRFSSLSESAILFRSEDDKEDKKNSSTFPETDRNFSWSWSAILRGCEEAAKLRGGSGVWSDGRNLQMLRMKSYSHRYNMIMLWKIVNNVMQQILIFYQHSYYLLSAKQTCKSYCCLSISQLVSSNVEINGMMTW